MKLYIQAGMLYLLYLLYLLYSMQPAWAERASVEYQVKAAFLFNFISFTEWPDGLGNTLNLCVYGPDPFDEDLDKLQGRSVGGRNLVVRRTNNVDTLVNCQIVFITRPMIANLPRVLDSVKGKPALTIADTPGAAREGVALNMLADQNKVAFEANLDATRRHGLNLSSKLLRLAREVFQ